MCLLLFCRSFGEMHEVFICKGYKHSKNCVCVFILQEKYFLFTWFMISTWIFIQFYNSNDRKDHFDRERSDLLRADRSHQRNVAEVQQNCLWLRFQDTGTSYRPYKNDQPDHRLYETTVQEPCTACMTFRDITRVWKP